MRMVPVKALKQTAGADAYATSLKQAAEIIINAARTPAAEKRIPKVARARVAERRKGYRSAMLRLNSFEKNPTISMLDLTGVVLWPAHFYLRQNLLNATKTTLIAARMLPNQVYLRFNSSVFAS